MTRRLCFTVAATAILCIAPAAGLTLAANADTGGTTTVTFYLAPAPLVIPLNATEAQIRAANPTRDTDITITATETSVD